ncbi:MAG: cytochrome C, partial [Pseudomonadota bacterium]
MKKTMTLVVILLLLPWQSALADAADAVKSPRGYGSKGYVWGKPLPEQAEVLKLSGDPVRGKEAFRGC